jgi:hypothetical protein
MEFTKGGNPKPPSMDVWLDWVCQAWDSLSKEAISKSFRDCGITVSTDGSEDGEIHCFKEHGPVPEGRQMLNKARVEEDNNINLIEEIDPDEDEKDYDSDASIEL